LLFVPVHPLLVQLLVLFAVFLQNSYSTHFTPVSVDTLLATALLNHCVYAGSAVIVGAVGAVVSNNALITPVLIHVPFVVIFKSVKLPGCVLIVAALLVTFTLVKLPPL
jgi:hypothetical protein